VTVLKFAVVREDADIELAVCERVSARRALVVASGGCTALTLASRGVGVTAFDINPAQLAHVEAKRAAALRGDRAALNVGVDDASALNQRGEFEKLFRTLRRFVEEFVAPKEEIARYFARETTPDARGEIVETWRASRYWPVAFALAFHDPLLHAMFGPGATQHAAPGSYPGYFQRVFERGLLRDDGADNPFLRHVFLGAYDPALPPEYVARPPKLAIDLVRGSLLDVPDLARFDIISLSNVFDWSDDSLARAWGERIAKDTRRGCAVIIRQLNNRRDVRRFFGDAFVFDDALSEALVARDRSLFYERIEVGFR
jgi:S-adenosylmethionine-diacylglycerol 3-amino-3-carboxypropyl transferase